MKSPRVRLSDAYQVTLRLTENRKMIASAKVAHIKDRAPEPAQRSPQERIALWTAETIARRPLR